MTGAATSRSPSSGPSAGASTTPNRSSAPTEGDAETSGGESGLDDTGDTSGGVMLDQLDVDAFVACDGQDCEIDEAFARRLYTDPSPLLAQSTQLVYQAKAQRHVLRGVDPGSLAHALGLRTGDQLESIDGMIIHDLDSALRAYVQIGDATAIEVKVKRGSQWLDFTYTFVP
jgi:S1-C subfamily serine protease